MTATMLIRSRAGAMLASSVLALGGTLAAASAGAASPPTEAQLRALGLQVGTENNGDIYGVDPAGVLRLLCTSFLEDGVLCVFTRDGESGRGVIIVPVTRVGRLLRRYPAVSRQER